MNFIERIKANWGIRSNWHFILINIVFAISGSLTVYVRKPVFLLLGIDQQTPLLLKVFLYLLIVTPAYFTILILVATLFGQFRFFWNFEKRFFSHFYKKRKEKWKCLFNIPTPDLKGELLSKYGKNSIFYSYF